MHSSSRLEASLRNSRGKLPRISYGAKSVLPTVFGKLHAEPFYTTVSPCKHTEEVLHSSCLSQMSLPCKTQLLSLVQLVHTLQLSFLLPHHYRHSSSPWLTLHMRPMAIALNYSVKNIWNKIRQKIIIGASLSKPHVISQTEMMSVGSFVYSWYISPHSVYMRILIYHISNIFLVVLRS